MELGTPCNERLSIDVSTGIVVPYDIFANYSTVVEYFHFNYRANMSKYVDTSNPVCFFAWFSYNSD